VAGKAEAVTSTEVVVEEEREINSPCPPLKVERLRSERFFIKQKQFFK